MRRVGILGAMAEEIDCIVSIMEQRREQVKGMRTYHLGTINSVEVVVVFSRWGKVASATTVTHMIVEFGITELLFIGVAGAMHADLQVGDIVLGSSLVQHDMDARPIMRQFEIPLLGQTTLEAPLRLLERARVVLMELIEQNRLINLLSAEQKEKFSIKSPKLAVGQIASGDRFFARDCDKKELLRILPEVLCVEMEGAAVAQVCFEYGLPCIVIRTISDEANEHAVVDFSSFVSEVASRFGVEIIKKMI